MKSLLIFIAFSFILVLVFRKKFKKKNKVHVQLFIATEGFFWILSHVIPPENGWNLPVKYPFSTFLIFISLIAFVITIRTKLRYRSKLSAIKNPNNERQSSFIDSGIFRYIRSPHLFSFLSLVWGIFLLGIAFDLFVIAALTSVFTYQAAKTIDQNKQLRYGNAYEMYMKYTKLFIPFIY